MASPHSRKTAILAKLKKKLNEGKQSLADQFEYKMFVAFVFKDKVCFTVVICWYPDQYLSGMITIMMS